MPSAKRKRPDPGAVYTWQALKMGGWPDHKIRLWFYRIFWRDLAKAGDFQDQEIAEQSYMLHLFGQREPTTKWVEQFYPDPPHLDPEEIELLDLIEKHLNHLNHLTQ